MYLIIEKFWMFYPDICTLMSVSTPGTLQSDSHTLPEIDHELLSVYLRERYL